jgi:hypothetical protein
MGILDSIKATVGGDPHAATAEEANAPEDSYLGTQLSPTGVVLEPATEETDPATRDVGAEGVQPVSKSVEVDREQGRQEHRDIDVDRKN